MTGVDSLNILFTSTSSFLKIPVTVPCRVVKRVQAIIDGTPAGSLVPTPGRNCRRDNGQLDQRQFMCGLPGGGRQHSVLFCVPGLAAAGARRPNHGVGDGTGVRSSRVNGFRRRSGGPMAAVVDRRRPASQIQLGERRRIRCRWFVEARRTIVSVTNRAGTARHDKPKCGSRSAGAMHDARLRLEASAISRPRPSRACAVILPWPRSLPMPAHVAVAGSAAPAAHPYPSKPHVLDEFEVACTISAMSGGWRRSLPATRSWARTVRAALIVASSVMQRRRWRNVASQRRVIVGPGPQQLNSGVSELKSVVGRAGASRHLCPLAVLAPVGKFGGSGLEQPAGRSIRAVSVKRIASPMLSASLRCWKSVPRPADPRRCSYRALSRPRSPAAVAGVRLLRTGIRPR